MSDWPMRLMIYGAGEAIDGSGALAPQIQAQLARLAQVCTNSYVAAIAQLDSSSVQTPRYVLDPGGRQPIYRIPNVDVGDPSQLLDFVKWSAAVCPAQRSVLVLSGHGAAWEDSVVNSVLNVASRSVTAVPSVPGALHHPRSLFGKEVSQADAMARAVLIDGNDRDYLSNAELGAACAEISRALGRKIDVLVFDACLMSACEILQELSGSVSTVVASIDELSAAGIDLARPASILTSRRGEDDAIAIARTIAGNFTPQAAFDSCVAINLSDSNWGLAISEFRDFCAAFLSWVQQSAGNAQAAVAALRNATTSVVEFTTGGLADFNALATSIYNIANIPPDAASKIKSASDYFNACVLAHSAGQDYASAMGLSIFSPGSVTMYGTNRADYTRLQFAVLTGWSAILDTLYGFESEYTRTLTRTLLRFPVSST